METSTLLLMLICIAATQEIVASTNTTGQGIPRKRRADSKSQKFCKIGFRKFGDLCYRLHLDEKNFADAMSECKSHGKGGTLATARSPEENKDVLRIAQGMPDLWQIRLGGTVADGQWRWRDQVMDWTNWAPEKPCMYMNLNVYYADIDGSWTSTYCVGSFAYVCQHDPESNSCNAGFQKEGDYCYMVRSEWYKKKFTAAMSDCQSLGEGKGGTVATPKNQEENVAIVNVVGSEWLSWGVWLGASLSHGKWTWHDGKLVEWTNWDNYHQQCLNMQLNSFEMEDSRDPRPQKMWTPGTWLHAGCFSRAPYVCQYDAGTDCAPGSHSNGGKGPCLLCPRGQYQGSAGQKYCRHCPTGLTTLVKGSKRLSQCRRKRKSPLTTTCPAGSMSRDGSKPCEQCHSRSYQDQTESTYCKPCPYGYDTYRRGATRAYDCKGNKTCVSSGDPHFKSFDGLYFDFQGERSHTFARDCYGGDFEVRINMKRKSRWNPNRGTLVGDVTVEWKKWTIVLGRQHRGKNNVTINSKQVGLPYKVPGLDIWTEWNHWILLWGYHIGEDGLFVMWNGYSYVSVQVEGKYIGKTCGLCGNNDGDLWNDEDYFACGVCGSPHLGKISNLKTSKDKELTEEEMAGITIVNPLHPGNSTWQKICDEAGKDVKTRATAQCSVFKNKELACCSDIFSAEVAYANCVHDVCGGGGDDDMLCRRLNDYATTCSTEANNRNVTNMKCVCLSLKTLADLCPDDGKQWISTHFCITKGYGTYAEKETENTGSQHKVDFFTFVYLFVPALVSRVYLY